jgi:DNA polymerase III subunit epsilon
VVDTETTGLGADARVLEVAFVVLDERLVEVASFETLLDPGDDVDLGATHIHGIARADVRRQPRFTAVAKRLEQTFQGSVFVAHNASFDLRMLRQEAQASGTPIELPSDYLDTMVIARRLGLPGKLVSLADELGVRVDTAHRALADVRTTAEVLRRLADRDPSVLSAGTARRRRP